MKNNDKVSIFISHPSNYLTNYQPHGDGLIAFGFINQLAQRGHTLHVAAPTTDIQGKLHENIRIYPIDVEIRAYSPIKSIEYMFKVKQIFNRIRREYKIDVIHQLNPVNSGLTLSLVGTGLPVVLGPFWASWSYNVEPKINSSKLKSLFFDELWPSVVSHQQQQHATALLISTPAAVREISKFVSNKNKIYDFPPGIDSTLFSPDPNKSTKEKEDLSILFLANLEYRKGIFTLLDAFESVVAALPSCRLTIAGSGTQLEEIQRRISTMSSKSQIFLVGNVERTNVCQYMRQCTVYCLPSYGEPFGMSALEAMSCGKAVVATNVGGLAHLVPDQGGRKVPPRDAQALANALLEILCSPELQTKMGQYNRSLVEKKYSWEQVIMQLESIYYKSITQVTGYRI